ncbi:MAG: 5-(carboxyamino)imidazole ribonucleotide synthase [Acidobacteria bacterium]|nr:5-(carboxyamino)imidazole ribonucleotide synthase [Acidobacteriota bacterium]MBS1866871.1 5-(carboxyamino)imidazole ribonucleotide synthase [Acidobacteriota bacterium]
MTIGILGGGQLGYMLALAGYPLGLHFRFLDPSPEAPVGRIAQRVTAEYTDEEALEKFVSGLELVTYEFENVPVRAARCMATHVPVYPPPEALEAAQDRLNEKRLFEKLGIATTSFADVNKQAELDAAVKKIGLPAVLKTRRMGYDGKGQWVLRTQDDVAAVKKDFPNAALILENFVEFQRELSILAVRGRSGETAFYPLVENHHRGGILRLSIAPAPKLNKSLQEAGERVAQKILQELNYAGVLAIEFFECNGELVANEMAPRVHNSGHWSIEGSATSQFENHLRAVLGMPLGSTATPGVSAMLNLIGETPEAAEVLAIPDAHLHLYGKSLRPGRKVGHVTLRAANLEELLKKLRMLPAFFQREEFCLPFKPACTAV